MKTTLCFILTLIAFVMLAFVPNSFAQDAPPEYVVQVVYFIPNDRSPEQDIDAKLDRLIKRVQQFYKDEMERHGFGRKTFRLETDAAEKTVVHHVNGQFTSSHYANDEDTIFTIVNKVVREVDERFDRAKNIVFVVADLGSTRGGGEGGGDSHGGGALINIDSDCKDLKTYFNLATHELGHAFGLVHDFRNESYILGYGSRVVVELSKCDAEWLDVHRYFNTSQSGIDTPTTIQMLPPLEYPPNAIRLRFTITDANGLHQARLSGPTGPPYFDVGLIACKRLNGENITVEFVTTADFITGPYNSAGVKVIDVNGNFTSQSFPIRAEDIHVDVNNRVDINGDGVINADDRVPAKFRIVSGDNQPGSPKSWLANPLVVEVRDADDKPVVGIEVVFRVIGGAVLSDPNPRTDSNGRAQTSLLLPNHYHGSQVEASIAGVSERVTFNVRSAPPVLLSRSERPPMYWIIEGDNPRGGRVDGLIGDRVEIFGRYATDVTLDVSPNGKLYWAAATVRGKPFCGAVLRVSREVSTSRSRSEELAVFNARPLAIAIDTTKGKLYWTNSHGNIQRANLDGSNIQNLITGLDSPKHIAVDTVQGKLYWTETQDSIRRANLNGSNVETLATGLSTLGSITIAGDKLYWTEKIGEELGKISRANLDGSNVEDIITLSSVPVGVAVDIADNKLYWTETRGHIRRANLDGSNIEDIVTDLIAPGQLILNVPPAALTDIANMDRITISEIMVASNDGSLPQWIELYNRSNTHEVNLMGWVLEIQNLRPAGFNELLNITHTFKEKFIKPQETLLIVSKEGRFSDNFQKEQVYNLNILQSPMLSEEGFNIKLTKSGTPIDEVGNLNDSEIANKKLAWTLPKSVTKDGERSSMIRRYDGDVPRFGTEKAGWISAKNTKLLTSTTHYYGHPNDIGAPGVRSGGALPVSLSHFRAEHTEASVVLKWTTESEVDNAGFYIYRSQTKDGEFKVVNPTMIQGAGTTGERNEYTWTDATAKPNTVYYYRIEDVSHAGVRKQLATVRLRGLVSAAGKRTIMWVDLKMQK